MYVLDTDHVSLMDRASAEGVQIRDRIAATPAIVAVSIISYEEQVRGWMAELARVQGIDRQMAVYTRLERMRGYYCTTPVLPFDDKALAQYQSLWLQRLRVGTMDLKIAAIALANEATLLTRNLSDFGKVPGLKAEDWSV
jgi:tRNA(fMet)-specific endonuclease VapC